MIRIRESAGESRRRLVAGAALGTAAALALSGLVAAPAFAEPSGSATGTGTNQPGRTATLTVSPATGLSTAGPSELELTGVNYATANSWGGNFGGAYLLFGVISPKDAADPGSWAPSKGGISGTNYDYASGAGVYQSMVNYPGNTTEPGVPFMDANGDWSGTLAIPGPQFLSQAGNAIDCLDADTQCGVITIGAHGAQSAGVEVFTPVTFEAPTAPAVETSLALAAASPASNAVKGTTDVSLSAAITPADAVGQVEFLTGDTLIGAADVANGTAQFVTKDLPGGLQTLSARFVPSDPAAFSPSVSPEAPARTVRVIDTTRIVADIEVGEAVAEISEAELTWSVSNPTATGTNVHKKSVVSGDVALTNAGSEAERDFVFSGGTGHRDAEGNARIAFSGSIQLATRTNDIQRIVLTDPVLHTNAAGDGYVTAHFSGNRPSGAYAPVQNVTIATVRGVAPSTAEGRTSFEVVPVWEGQTAAGTWAGEYTSSFPNEFVVLLDSAIRADFTLAGTSAAQQSKAPRAMSVTYRETEVVPVPEPTGTSAGTPLSGNTSYIVVEPGEQLRTAGPTQLTLKGFGFDPGSATVPGTGSGGIYVGFGTMKDPSDPEKWRRSKGGSSGPVGFGDFTYGIPVFVANQNSADGDVADGMMDAEGNWTATVTIPGKNVPSFFGDTIDCLAAQCGFFSFGAHGAIKAKNEAFTPVYFAGQTTPQPEPAVETSTDLAAQPTGEYPLDFAGEEVTVSASVTPQDAAGTVEFFAGAISLGGAPVETGLATITTDRFAGGAHKVTAVFTPADTDDFTASVSLARTFRIVDLAPVVLPIETGPAVKQITDASLTWSIANFLSFGSGPAKSVLGGEVVLGAEGDFEFSNGVGVEDAAGNRVVSFDGAVRLTSGSMPEWNFRDPEVHVNAAGDGYLTAVVDGHYLGSLIGGEDRAYGPIRVTVSTFTQAGLAEQGGTTSFTVSPTFEGQVAAGTWSGSFTGATFANEFLQHINSGVRSFFLQSGSSSDATKAGRPITVSFESAAIPAAELAVSPQTGLDRAGADLTVSGTGFDTSGKPSYPGAPDAPAGIYVSLGWISNDGWRPSENAASASRVAVVTKWVQETEPTGGQYVRWETDAFGRAGFEFQFDGVTYAEVLAKKPATGDYRLAVYSMGASGVKQASNEFASQVAFASAAATTTTVTSQVSGDFPTDFAGEPVEVTATVAPAVAGVVEFFSDGASLGTTDAVQGTAVLQTEGFTGGAHQVTAVFTPENAVLHEGSTSAAQTFRIVDTARVIDDIVLGAPVEQITGASFGWSVANYFSSFGYEFGKEAIGSAVSVPEPVAGDKEFNSNRLFTFSQGTGQRDSDGNTVIDFEGTAKVTSGVASEWNFANPRVHVNAAGAGYVTAEFSGFFRMDGLGEYLYESKRVTVATFAGAQAQTSNGQTSLTVTPIWEGQVAPGTWAADYTGSFPAEFTSLLYTGIRSFFMQTGTSGANLTKPVQPISLVYTAGTAPAITGQPAAVVAAEGETATFSATVSGAPAPQLQWQRRASVDEAWTDVPGATDSQLVLTGLARADSGAQFRLLATNAFGSVPTDTAALTVTPAKPTTDPAAPVLAEDNSGGFTVVSVAGRTVTVNVGSDHALTWIGVTLHSDPRFLGWSLADANGLVTVQVPTDVTGSHRLSFVTADGQLLGWVPVSFAEGGTSPVAGGPASALSRTGSEFAPLVMGGSAALLLLVAGAVTLVASRRRRAGASTE